MRPARQNTYKSPDEIDAIIREREEAVKLLPPGEIRQRVMAEVVQLRCYATMKRLLAPQSAS